MARAYPDIQRQTLELINQATMGGAPIGSAYNNQVDYEKRIPHLINIAVRSITTTAKRIVKVATLTGGTEMAGGRTYRLPRDFYQLKSGGVYAMPSDGPLLGLTQFRLLGRELYVPASAQGPVLLEYYAYPPELPSSPGEYDELDVDPEVLDAAQVYAAAQLVSGENEYLYASLYNDYESRLSRISQGVVAQPVPVQDQYGFGVGGDLY